MSTSVLKALPGKLDIKRHSPSILYLLVWNVLWFQTLIIWAARDLARQCSCNHLQCNIYKTLVSAHVVIYRGSYMSAHVLLNLLNELGKRDKMRGLSSILSLFCNEFNKFNNKRARMLDSIHHMTLRLLWRKNVITLSLCTQRCYGRHNVYRKSINH